MKGGLLTKSEVQKLLRVSEPTLRRLINENIIIGFRLPNSRRVYFKKEQIDEALSMGQIDNSVKKKDRVNLFTEIYDFNHKKILHLGFLYDFTKTIVIEEKSYSDYVAYDKINIDKREIIRHIILMDKKK
jgi:excisionase family DNA binding protein